MAFTKQEIIMEGKQKELTLEDIQAMNRAERRKIKKATGVMLPGSMKPYEKRKKN